MDNTKICSKKNYIINMISDIKEKVNTLNKLIDNKKKEVKYVKNSTLIMYISKFVSLICFISLCLLVCFNINPIVFVLLLFSLTGIAFTCFRVSNNIMKKYKKLGITNRKQILEMIDKMNVNISRINGLISKYEDVINEYNKVLNNITIDFVNNCVDYYNLEYKDIMIYEKIYKKIK